MKYNIPTIAAVDLDIAASAEIGLESRVHLSYEPVRLVGEILFEAEGNGTDDEGIIYTPDNTYTPPADAGDGRDFQLVAIGPVLSTTAVVVTASVVFEGGANGTITATLAPPETAADQSFNFPQGLAVDFVPSVANNTIRTITAITVADGGSSGARFAIVAMPERASYTEVACTEGKSPTPPAPNSVSIPCGYDSARWVKRGRSVTPELGMKARYKGFGDGLMRANGHRVTAMLEVWKEDRILSERQVFGGWRPKVAAERPDGEGEVMADASGQYEFFAVFV